MGWRGCQAWEMIELFYSWGWCSLEWSLSHAHHKASEDIYPHQRRQCLSLLRVFKSWTQSILGSECCSSNSSRGSCGDHKPNRLPANSCRWASLESSCILVIKGQNYFPISDISISLEIECTSRTWIPPSSVRLPRFRAYQLPGYAHTLNNFISGMFIVCEGFGTPYLM